MPDPPRTCDIGRTVISCPAVASTIHGSTTIGIGTALFYDPLLCKKINAGIADYLARHELGSIAELVGTLKA